MFTPSKKLIKQVIWYEATFAVLMIVAFAVLAVSRQALIRLMDYNMQIIATASIVFLISLIVHTRLNRASVENTKLYENLKDSQDRIDKDLETARHVQESILHRAIPKDLPLMIAGHCLPSASIGGDFYQVNHKPEKKIIECIIGDVAGHGVASALVMTMSYIYLRELSTKYDSPSEILYNLNNRLCEELQQRLNHLTCFIISYNYETKTITYAQGGHDDVIIIDKNNNKIERLSSRGLIIGKFINAVFEEKSLQYDSSKRIILFTDGITEHRNNEGNWFEEERLIEHLKNTAGEAPIYAVNNLYKNTQEFSPNIRDDQTILILDT
ncbi:PP2C family protein-serine/threonine phosphatase [Candidatus Margulisiibacteriota bacterium]